MIYFLKLKTNPTLNASWRAKFYKVSYLSDQIELIELINWIELIELINWIELIELINWIEVVEQSRLSWATFLLYSGSNSKNVVQLSLLGSTTFRHSLNIESGLISKKLNLYRLPTKDETVMTTFNYLNMKAWRMNLIFRLK